MIRMLTHTRGFSSAIKAASKQALALAFVGGLTVTASSVVDAQQVPQRLDLVPVTAQPITPAGQSSVARRFDVTINKAHVVEFTTPVSNIVLGNETIADVYVEPANPRRVFIIAREIGSTNVYFMDGSNNIMDQAEVQVVVDADGIRDAVTRLMPDENIEISVYGSSVFLNGTVESSTKAANAFRIVEQFVGSAADITNLLTVTGSQQVILQVKVAEIDRATRKQLTASNTLSFTRPFGDLSLTTAAGAVTNTNLVTGSLNLNVFDNNIGTTTLGALEQQSLVKTLAEPTLTAISGETATFLSGGETAIATGADENGNALVEYRDIGIRLEFTPQVLDKGRINLALATEISALDSNNDSTIDGNTYSGFNTKRTETALDLPSGGTIMISGLLEDSVTDTIRGMPFLKDLPILGALFRSTEFQLDQSELIVTVTAYLAEPTGGSNALSLPTDGFETASDIDIYLLGRLHREYSDGNRHFWESPVVGPFGYMMK